jgi:hypothetical protein
MNTFMQFGPPVLPPKIDSLVFFTYLDEARVEELYGLIQSEWQWREHTLEGSSAIRAEARAGPSGFSIGANVKRGAAGKSPRSALTAVTTPRRERAVPLLNQEGSPSARPFALAACGAERPPVSKAVTSDM